MRSKILFASLLSTIAPATAIAQSQPVSSATPPPTVPTSQNPAAQPRSVAAVDPQATGDSSPDIIVTAQKRAERIQDVPIAITVVSGEALNRSGAKNLTELQGLAPGIFVSGNTSYGGSPISIRGTAGTNSTLLDDPVAVYVNGVYQASGAFSGTSFLDVGSIEIVRGPQGTLQGRNATAGAVLVRTADPTSTLGGYARFSIADPQEVRGEAAVGGPLNDTLGFRVAGNFFDERGWAYNTFNGDHIGGGHGYAVRGTLRWRPTDKLDLRFIAGRTLTYAKPALIRWAATSLSTLPTGPLVLPGTATPAVPLTQTQIDAVKNDNNFSLNSPTFNRIDDNSLALDATYSLGTIDLVSVTGYDKIGNRGATDSDGLGITDRYGFNTGTLPTENVSQEFRLQSNGHRRLTWILGGYFSNSEQDMDFFINNLQFTTADRRTSRFTAFQDTKSYAAFADGTFHLTPELAVIGGVRYTRETKNFSLHTVTYNYDTLVPIVPLVQYRPAQAVFRNTSYRAKLTYQPTSDILLYASYSTGFKGGGFNAFGADPALNPEKLSSAEAGVKADFLDRRASIAIAGYTNRYDDLQVRVGVPSGGVAITNAANSKIDGFELEGTLRPISALSLSGNIAYTNARFTSFPLARNLLNQGPFDASGNKLPRTPAWQFYLLASSTPPLTDKVTGLFEASFRFHSRIYFYQTGYPTQGEPVGELGLRAGLTFVPEQLSITAFATNVNNGRSVNGININFSYPDVSFNKSRSAGLQLEKKF